MTNVAPEALVGRGMALAPEGRGMFRDLTVAENLELGAYAMRDKAKVAEAADRAYGTFPILGRAPRTEGRTALGRAAADARNRARVDEQTHACFSSTKHRSGFRPR